jgi:hypothetical protein
VEQNLTLHNGKVKHSANLQRLVYPKGHLQTKITRVTTLPILETGRACDSILALQVVLLARNRVILGRL